MEKLVDSVTFNFTEQDRNIKSSEFCVLETPPFIRVDAILSNGEDFMSQHHMQTDPDLYECKKDALISSLNALIGYLNQNLDNDCNNL